MNTGISFSFFIGGMLLIMILTLNFRMGQHAIEVTYHGISQISKYNLVEMIEHDLSNIGYTANGPVTNPISIATETEIEFESNVFNDISGDTQIIKWKLGDTQPSHSANPDHRILYRIVDSDTTAYSSSISHFQITYFQYGDNVPLNNPNTGENRGRIHRLEINLFTQSNESIIRPGNDNYFTTSSYSKKITPPNLNLYN